MPGSADNTDTGTLKASQLSTNNTLGGGSPSNTLIASQAAVQAFVNAGLANKLNTSALSTDTNLGSGSPSNSLVPSQAAVKTYADTKYATASISTDTSLGGGGASDTVLASQKAVKAYVDAHSGGGGGGGAPFTVTANDTFLETDDYPNDRRIYLDSNYNVWIASGASESGGIINFDSSDRPWLWPTNNTSGQQYYGWDSNTNPRLSAASESYIGFDGSNLPFIAVSANSSESYIGFDFNFNPRISGSSNSGFWIGFDSSQYPAIYYNSNPVFAAVSGNAYNYAIYNNNFANPVVGADSSGHGFLQDASESGGFIGFSGGPNPLIQSVNGGIVTFGVSDSSTLQIAMNNLATSPASSESVYAWAGDISALTSYLAGGGKILAIGEP